MRAALVLLAVCLAGPALAQEGSRSLEVQTINGVRVWRPKSPAAPAERQAAPAPTTVVVINNLPAPEPSPGEVIGLPVGRPFFHRPSRGPFWPRPGVRPPHVQPQFGVQPYLSGRPF